MICPQCGLPVSPSRKSCPRCGIPVEEMRKRGEPGQGAAFPRSPSSSPQQEDEKSKQQSGAMPSREGNPVQQASAVNKPQLRTQQRKTQVSLSPGTFFNSPARMRLGFTIAGICIGVGALILILVFIMAQSLPAAVNAEVQVQPTSQTEGNKGDAAVLPPTPSPAPTTPGITPTSAATGSKYIDNVQIGSNLDMTRVQIAQSTRDFQAGQRIYITMNVNSIGYQGAVCLDWYVQNAFLTHYAFSTTADPSQPHATAWSYAISTRQGSGYVNVFWASSLACADKMLAQRVDFNVGG